MFTAARLVAALLFAVIGYFAAIEVFKTFPEGIRATWFAPSIGAIGLWQGWVVMGPAAGRGFLGAMGVGLRTSLQITFFGLALYALREMFRRSANLRYDDFGVAVIDAMNLFIEYLGDLAMIPTAIGVLAIGGLVAGLLTEAASRVWR